MKRIFTFVLFYCVSFAALSQTTTNYVGNGGKGFNSNLAPGPIGGSSLAITENATTLTFTLTKGGGTFDDAFVIYMDVTAGNGENSTLSYSDASDPSKTAISGLSYESSPGNGIRNRSILNFSSGFGADFAIAVSPFNNIAGLYSLNASPANHTLLQSAGLSPQTNNSATYTFSIQKSNIGFANTTAAFTFIGTYLNSGFSTYRSNEGYGTFVFSAVNGDGNPGYNATTAATALIYPLVVLPVRLLSFTGSVVDSKGKLTWRVANDNEINHYELEKSTDGKQFTTLQTVAALRTSALQTYTTDDATLSVSSLYRLKTTDLKGVVNYSKIVQLSVGVKGQGFTIFPNPVQQTLNLKPAKLEKGRYDVNVYSASGQLVLTKVVQYDGLGNTLQVELPGSMPHGNYNCILCNATGKFASSFLKQ